jgi:hypothetical protein
MKDPIHSAAVSVRFLGATNTKGARIKLTLCFNGKSKVSPYCYEQGSPVKTALAWLAKRNLFPMAVASGEKATSLLIFGPEDTTPLYVAFNA